MKIEQAVSELQSCQQFFHRSTRALEESDSSFAPVGEVYTVAQHVAHVAQTLDWFLAGGLGNWEWDMDFEKHDREVRKVTSLIQARQQLDAAFTRVIDRVKSFTEEQLAELSATDDPIFQGAPRSSTIFGIIDHTAHHRGALTIYTRQLGKTPPMPYMD